MTHIFLLSLFTVIFSVLNTYITTFKDTLVISKMNDLSILDKILSTVNVQKNKRDLKIPKISFSDDLLVHKENLLTPNEVAANVQDSLALVTLYNATNGNQWIDNDNWLTGPLYSWYGVNIDANGKVHFLTLNNNNLVGILPGELGNLTELERLYLSDNQLTGVIPPEIGNLSNLERLFLDNNQFTGNIPVELGNLNQLNYLDLSFNQLTGSIPAEIGNLSNIRILHLNNNQLSGSIPVEIGNLTNIQELWLNFNQLSGNIPSEIQNLSILNWLYLSNNQLTGDIPPELENLSHLQYLFLFSNQLSGNIPIELSYLSDLKGLWLNDNQLVGSIPPELGNLSDLEWLYLSNNQLTGSIPPELGSLSNLRDLGLDYNQLEGAIPMELGNLSNLQNLYLNNNQLTQLPDYSSMNLNNLFYWDVSNNRLTFTGLEDDTGIGQYFYYSPQAKVGQEASYYLDAGGALTLSVNVGGEHNTYQWYLNGRIIVSARNNTYTITNFNPIFDSGVYYCRIQNTQATSLTLQSEDINVYENILSVNNNSGYFFKVYPNPAQREINIETNSDSRDIRFDIINIAGQRVKTFDLKTGKKSINIGDLSQGIYIIQMKNKNEILNYRKLWIK